MKTREFIAIDGEGVTRSDGTHDYVLLCASDGASIERWTRGGLSTMECLAFLIELKQRHPAATFVVFGGSYDFQMMLGQVAREPDATWERMRHNQYFTLRGFGETYKIQTLFRHSLYVARGFYRRDDGRWNWHKQDSITVWDTLGWFQQSFVAAVEAWGIRSKEWLARVGSMKQQRATFGAPLSKRIKKYCIDECEALVDLMTRVDETLADLGIRPARWDGAGAGAAALLRSQHIAEQIVRPANIALENAQMCAYYGGRIQQLAAGVVDETVYTLDLPSAYPEAIAELPSLFGRWRHTTDINELADRRYAIVRVRWDCPQEQRITPFPYRKDGVITWPATGEGWYWLEELDAVLAHVRAELDILESWIYEPADAGERPFAFMRALIDRRLEWKRQGDARARLLKLILNAVYGKLVQSSREKRVKLPSFQSYAWGGMVTASIRAKMFRLAAQLEAVQPRSVIAVATDSVFTTLALDHVGPDHHGKLQPCVQDWHRCTDGEYEHGEIDPGLMIVQAGVMVTPRARYVRSRGFARTSITYEACVSAWDAEKFNGVVTVEERRFITADWATFVGKREIWRTWQDIERDLTFATLPKMWPRRDLFGKPGKYGRQEPLYPPAGPEGAFTLSEPYNPRYELPEREEWEYQRIVLEQPDVEIDDGAVK